ncbi:MAG: PhzF family phenazine biosynthesis protein [Thermoflexibacteraceae bacterium]|jgi:PhzF family phenazine biosynthesis protein
MQIPIYQVDAFSDKVFGGNPAAVCPLSSWLADDILQKIAQENNLAETAFFVPTEKGFHLRWFTPELEIDLCGHATLATAHVLFTCLGYAANQITFQSKSGELIVSRQGDLLTLDFPTREPQPTTLPQEILEAIGVAPQEVLKARDYVLVYENEEVIQKIAPNAALLQKVDLGTGGVIVTAKGNTVDFVSRFFTPQASLFEDPVTGSAHCSLIPFWAKRLGKNNLHAYQISARKGELFCELLGERVKITGKCVLYLEGRIWV